ncbi:MAG TPA: hypothetical protein PKN56_25565, partial [Leptospiraceae bacterium]|nr:hypothetical protein [Leptospiraceae bacterium]
IYPFMKNSRQPHPSEKFTAPTCKNSEETERSENSESGHIQIPSSKKNLTGQRHQNIYNYIIHY